jgi:diacylglycerol kinase family enzyme
LSKVPSRLLVVANPATRRNVADIADLLRQAAPSDVAVDVRLTRGPGADPVFTRDEIGEVSCVVAIGGDGTVAGVATLLMGTEVPLGIIPAGSTNVIARDLRIPKAPQKAVALLLGKHRQKLVDVGLCGNRAFIHMAGAGFDSRLFDATSPSLKRRIGWLAYLPAASRNLLGQPSRFTIVADGVTTEVVSPLVLVANGGSIISPSLPLYPGIRRDDGWLDVLIFTPTGPVRIARTLTRFATRGLVRSPYVVRFQARHVSLTADPPLPVQLDGDVVAGTPVTFGIAPASLSIIVPPTA